MLGEVAHFLPVCACVVGGLGVRNQLPAAAVSNQSYLVGDQVAVDVNVVVGFPLNAEGVLQWGNSHCIKIVFSLDAGCSRILSGSVLGEHEPETIDISNYRIICAHRSLLLRRTPGGLVLL
jgi:hypothetical protein